MSGIPQQTFDRPSATTPASASAVKRGQPLDLVKARLKSLGGPIIGLVIMVIGLSIASPFFLTVRNIQNIISQISDLGIMAAGEALVILVGGIDLSLAATMAMTMMASAWLYKELGAPWEISMIVGLLLGAFVGLLNGLLSTYGRVQSFVATLATMSAATGIALYITNGNTINGFPDWFGKLTATEVLGIPLQGILLVAVFGALAFWLTYRPLGRAIYVVGGSEEVARLSGLPVRRLKTWVYVLAGALASVAGWINISRLDSAQPTAGSRDLLNVIAVVVIGGASLAGGVGTMGGTFVGLLIVGVLNNGLSLLHVNPNLQPVVIGAVILATVLTEQAGAKLRR
jgi:ribose transport system permease protein